MLRLDAETKALERPEHHRDELCLWLRLLTCTTMIEAEVRGHLREHCDVTLRRFDLMAQLDRAPDGLTPSELSRRIMVSNGNVTGLVNQLVETGHVERRVCDRDRRVQRISLTPLGRDEFRVMAALHEDWIARLFGGLTAKDSDALMRLLARLKTSVLANRAGAG